MIIDDREHDLIARLTAEKQSFEIRRLLSSRHQSNDVNISSPFMPVLVTWTRNTWTRNTQKTG
jgi:hypothetical protein